MMGFPPGETRMESLVAMDVVDPFEVVTSAPVRCRMGSIGDGSAAWVSVVCPDGVVSCGFRTAAASRGALRTVAAGTPGHATPHAQRRLQHRIRHRVGASPGRPQRTRPPSTVRHAAVVCNSSCDRVWWKLTYAPMRHMHVASPSPLLQSMAELGRVFSGFEHSASETVFVLIGNFMSRPFGQGA